MQGWELNAGLEQKWVSLMAALACLCHNSHCTLSHFQHHQTVPGDGGTDVSLPDDELFK